MSQDPADILHQFFSQKSKSGEPISVEEAAWMERLLTDSESQPIAIFEDSQSVIGQVYEENCFLSQTPSLSQYDASDALRKYKHFYSQQPLEQETRAINAKPSYATPKLAFLDSQKVLSPVMRMYQSKEETKLSQEENIQPSEAVDLDHEILQPAASQPCTEVMEEEVPLTKTASAIVSLLGKPTIKPEISVETKEGPKFIPETPAPKSAPAPFIVDMPGDGESAAKRVRLVDDGPKSNSVTPASVTAPSCLHEYDFTLSSSRSSSFSDDPLRRLALEAPQSQLPSFSFS